VATEEARAARATIRTRDAKSTAPLSKGGASLAPKSGDDEDLVGLQGELWLILQGALMVAIAGGDIPVAGSLLRLDLGALGMILGGGAVVLGALELGRSLSPFTEPVEAEGAGLRTEGIYTLCRHPMYAGLLILCASFGLLTDSATRLALTAVLFFVLDKKAELEEAALFKKYGAAYDSYKAITKRFLPKVY